MTAQKSYYRVRLGETHEYADECYQGAFIGVLDDGNFGDLSNDLPENRNTFIKKYRDIFLERTPNKKKSPGHACGVCWTICKGIKKGDIVLCSNEHEEYWVGEVISDYLYQVDSSLPHQRKVAWFSKSIARDDMSLGLKNSTKLRGTYANLTEHAKEIEKFISGEPKPQLIARDESIVDASEFALEEHLEDFLVQNWASTELGKKYDIIGQQYKTYTGFIDILAVSKDQKEFLVIELKKGRASDNVIGQILKYIGDIQQDLAKPEQKVRGAIIAFGDNKHFNRALSAVENVDFYEYKVNFKLSKK